MAARKGAATELNERSTNGLQLYNAIFYRSLFFFTFLGIPPLANQLVYDNWLPCHLSPPPTELPRRPRW